MTCPWCQTLIPENIYPLAHMTVCMNEEAKLWNARFDEAARRGAAERIEANGYDS